MLAGTLFAWMMQTLSTVWGIILVSAAAAAAAFLLQLWFSYNNTLGEIGFLVKQAAEGGIPPQFHNDEMAVLLRTELESIRQKGEQVKVKQTGMSAAWVKEELDRIENLRLPEIQSPEVCHRQLEQLQGDLHQSCTHLAKVIKINYALLQSAKIMNQSTEEMSKDVSRTAQTASEGIKSVGREIRAISDLKNTMGSSAKVIEDLNEMSRHVSQFITTIGTISRRTELLALNAGIEAARAGDAGKGFSVVANEIRTLSESSKRASEEMADLIREIETRTKNAVEAMRNTNKLEENIKVVYAAGDIFMHIVREIKAIDKLIKQLSAETEESSGDTQSMVILLNKLEHMLQEDLDIAETIKREWSAQSGLWHKMRNSFQSFSEQLKIYKTNP
ncbi:hypothetical protein JW933_03965 [candidate division FCPU426 bacterium]|nr:hypothetical protein [candidate division FCPU426 bacterium]